MSVAEGNSEGQSWIAGLVQRLDTLWTLAFGHHEDRSPSMAMPRLAKPRWQPDNERRRNNSFRLSGIPLKCIIVKCIIGIF